MLTIVQGQDIQGALNAGAGGTVVIPNGTYSGTSFLVPVGTTVVGESQDGVKIIQAPGTAGSVRLFVLNSATTLMNVSLFGNKANQVPDEHRAGVFVQGSFVTVANVKSVNFTGDGFYVYTGSQSPTFVGCKASNNDRDGIALNGVIDGCTLVDCYLSDNRAQQFDTEPVGGRITNTTVVGCSIIHGGSSDYAVTLAGAGATNLSSGYTLLNCTVDGSVEAVYAENVLIANNHITQDGSKAPVEVYRATENVRIVNNHIEYLGTTVGTPAIGVTSTASETPELTTIDGNVLHVTNPISPGIKLNGNGDTYIVGNDISGPSLRGANLAGIVVRSTVAAHPMGTVRIDNNTIAGFGDLVIGVSAVPGGTVTGLEVVDNRFVSGGIMNRGLVYDNAVRLGSLHTWANHFTGPFSLHYAVAPTGCSTLVGDDFAE